MHAPHLDALFHRLQTTALPYKERLAARIICLSAAFAEDYDGRLMSTRSLTDLIDFLELNPSFGYPDLTATPAGDAYAEWNGPMGRVTIEFASPSAKSLRN